MLDGCLYCILSTGRRSLAHILCTHFMLFLCVLYFLFTHSSIFRERESSETILLFSDSGGSEVEQLQGKRDRVLVFTLPYFAKTTSSSYSSFYLPVSFCWNEPVVRAVVGISLKVKYRDHLLTIRGIFHVTCHIWHRCLFHHKPS